MRCVVRIPWMYSLYSLAETPEDRAFLEGEGLEVEEGAWVEIPSDMIGWSTEGDRIAGWTLGRSQADPKHYQMFETPEGARRAGFEPTGLSFGGFYSPPMWERFTSALPSLKSFHAIPDDDPPGAVDLALSYLRRDR